MRLLDSMGPPTPRRPETAREDNEAEKARVREAERLCAHDFLTRPDHAERCICNPRCSRDYDPAPPMLSLSNRAEGRNGGESWAPTGGFYDGTGVGALYDGPMSASQAADLVGWNVKPGSKPE